MTDSLDLKHKVIHSIKWVALGKAVTQIFRWCLTFWVIRLLTPEDYGLVAMSDVFFGFTQLLVAALFTPGLIQAKELSERDLQRFFGAILVVYGCTFLLQMLFADVVADYYGAERVADILKINAWCLLVLAFAKIPSALLARELEFKSISIITGISNIGAACLTLGLALNGFGFWSLVSGEIFAIVCRSTLTLFVKPAFFFPRFDFVDISHYLKFGGLISIHAMLMYVFLHLDVALAGVYLTAEEIGLFALGLQFAAMPLKKILPLLNQVAFPAFSKIQGERSLLAYYVLKVQRLSWVVAIPLFWGLASVVDLVIPIILGEKWSGAIVPAAIIFMVMPLRFSYELFNPALKSLGMAWHMIANVSVATTLLAVALLLMVEHGAVGVSLAWALGFPCAYLIVIYRNCRVLNIQLKGFLQAATTPVVSGAVMVCAVIATKLMLVEVTLFALLCQMVAGAIAYLATIHVLNPSLWQEMRSLRSSVGSGQQNGAEKGRINGPV